MAKWILFVSVLILSQWFLPWYFLCFVSLVFALIFSQEKRAFLFGLKTGFTCALVWVGMALLKDANAEFLISKKLSSVLGVESFMVFLGVGLLALFVGMMASFSGSYLKRAFLT